MPVLVPGSRILALLALLTAPLSARGLDPDLVCRTERIVMGVIRAVEPRVGTNGKPPRVTLKVHMTLKGPEFQGELVGLWAPEPPEIPEDAPDAAKRRETWAAAPLPGPSRGKPWILLLGKQGDELVFLSEYRGLASRSHMIRLTEALECGARREQNFFASQGWMDAVEEAREEPWEQIRLEFSTRHPKGERRRFLVREDGQLTLQVLRRGQRPARQTRRAPPEAVRELLDDLEAAELFGAPAGKAPRRPRFRLQVRARRGADGPPQQADLSCSEDCPRAIQRAHSLLAELWRNAR